MASKLTHYTVYRCSHSTFGPRSHHAIFIPTVYDTESLLPTYGYRLHVTGSIQNGMKIEIREEEPSRGGTIMLPEWVRHEGWIRHEDIERAVGICNELPPPAKQFDGPKSLVPTGVPLRHGQHWVTEALDAMRAGGVLESYPEEEGDGERLMVALGGAGNE